MRYAVEWEVIDGGTLSHDGYTYELQRVEYHLPSEVPQSKPTLLNTPSPSLSGFRENLPHAGNKGG